MLEEPPPLAVEFIVNDPLDEDTVILVPAIMFFTGSKPLTLVLKSVIFEAV
jgi:hypothetical protein